MSALAVPSPSHVNLYELLGVPSDASMLMIRQAFRRLALRLHPDKVGSLHHHQTDSEQISFHMVKDAADCLLDCHQRALYDAQLGLHRLREDGEISDTFDLFEDFTLEDAQTDEGMKNDGTVQVYQMECRCGGLYEVVIVANRSTTTITTSSSARGNTGLASRQCMEYQGKKRVRHVVECDCCSLVIEVAGSLYTEDKAGNKPPLLCDAAPVGDKC